MEIVMQVMGSAFARLVFVDVCHVGACAGYCC